MRLNRKELRPVANLREGRRERALPRGMRPRKEKRRRSLPFSAKGKKSLLLLHICSQKDKDVPLAPEPKSTLPFPQLWEEWEHEDDTINLSMMGATEPTVAEGLMVTMEDIFRISTWKDNK